MENSCSWIDIWVKSWKKKSVNVFRILSPSNWWKEQVRCEWRPQGSSNPSHNINVFKLSQRRLHSVWERSFWNSLESQAWAAALPTFIQHSPAASTTWRGGFLKSFVFCFFVVEEKLAKGIFYSLTLAFLLLASQTEICIWACDEEHAVFTCSTFCSVTDHGEGSASWDYAAAGVLKPWHINPLPLIYITLYESGLFHAVTSGLSL